MDGIWRMSTNNHYTKDVVLLLLLPSMDTNLHYALWGGGKQVGGSK